MGIQSMPLWEVRVKQGNQKWPHWKGAFQQRCEEVKKQGMRVNGRRMVQKKGTPHRCPADTYLAW